MNSTIASNINGGVSNRQVASGSHSSILMSSIDFSLSETKTNFSVPSGQGRYLVKLNGKEELCNGENKLKNYDLNENTIDNDYSSQNGSLVNGNKVNRNEEKSSDEGMPVAKIQLYAGKIQVEWNQMHRIGAGLSNVGNTCFMNTVLQCLTYCPPLANYLLHGNDHASKCTLNGFCMMCLLQQHIKRAIGSTGQVIKPVEIYQRLRLIAKHFQFGRQEDAHEFLRYVIDNLWKSCLPQANGVSCKLDPAVKETTVINKIFGGYHRSQVICLRCKQKSNTYDHFMDFILDIKQNVMSLEKALEKFTQPELLQQENCYKCPKCKMKVEAQKRFSVYRAPTVATFQLKRFDYNRSFGGKITKQISYPEILNLRPYMSETKGDPVLYQLNAVLVHSGPTCNSGHYFCYVKNSNGFWYLMDDSRVCQVGIQQVLNQSAYVLFYIKRGNAERPHFKNCVDSKSSYLKGTLSNSRVSIQVSEVSITKSASFVEKSPSFATSKPFGSPNSVKKSSYPSLNREKISFGFRNSPHSVPQVSPKNRVETPQTPQSTETVRARLVPYVEDSSESSDASESNSLHKKLAKIHESKPLARVVSPDSCRSMPVLEVKTKLSKSFFNLSPSPRVSATSPWIVTDAPPTPCPGSNSSGVNSTTDWQVIEAAATASKSNDSGKEDCSRRESTDSAKLPASPIPSKMANGLVVSPVRKVGDFPKGPSSSQNCNFRNQFFKSTDEEAVSPAKRKSSDSYPKVFTDSSHSEHGQSQLSPLPKKTRYSETDAFLSPGSVPKVCENGVQKKYLPCCDSHSRTSLVNGIARQDDAPAPVQHNQNSGISNGTLEHASDACSVEESASSKAKHKDSFFSESSKTFLHERGKFPGSSNEGKNTSLYGTEVGTWREGSHYRPSIISTNENRRVFDSYDQDFDQGKVRKSKVQDRYQGFHRKNHFQKHADRYHRKYNGKFYGSHHNHKRFDSHHNWKSNHSDHYQRYRNHHHRRY